MYEILIASNFWLEIVLWVSKIYMGPRDGINLAISNIQSSVNRAVEKKNENAVLLNC